MLSVRFAHFDKAFECYLLKNYLYDIYIKRNVYLMKIIRVINYDFHMESKENFRSQCGNILMTS